MPPGRSRPAVAAIAAIALVLVLVPACGGGDTVKGPPPSAPASLRLSSPAFVENARIPARYTCSGENISPPLTWGRLPGGTTSLALLVEDPDAPGGTFVHWTVWDLSARSGGLRDGRVPEGAAEGENSFGHTRYDGPCPPKGDDPHHYQFLLYALREPLGLDAGTKPQDVQQAIDGRALASGRLVGRFGR